MDFKTDFIQIESRSKSDPTLSDIDFKNKSLGSELPLNKKNTKSKKYLILQK